MKREFEKPSERYFRVHASRDRRGKILTVFFFLCFIAGGIWLATEGLRFFNSADSFSDAFTGLMIIALGIVEALFLAWICGDLIFTWRLNKRK